MITLIESVLGVSVPRWVIELVLAVLLVGSAALYLEHRGAQHELAKLQRSSAALVAKAEKQITRDASDYAAAQKANQEMLDAAQAAYAREHADLDDSVRKYDAYRKAHPDVARTPRQPGAASGGECGARDCGAVVEELAVRGNELAGSLGGLASGLQACERDRDALTGKP